MAELTAGAVNALLGVLRDELLLLGRLGNDVQYIKEEMESMNSFLAHLARTTPPAGIHDEQVRSWMKQVRDLAQDCSSCIDLYLRRVDPEIHRARGPLRSFIWWLPWFVQKVTAQHRVAVELRQLKERAHDVGDRRMRYGVKVPGKEPPMPAADQDAHAGGDDHDHDHDEDEDEEGHQAAAAVPGDGGDHRRRRALLQPRSLEEYCAERLIDWLKVQDEAKPDTAARRWMPCIAIAAESGMDSTGAAIAREVLPLATAHFDASDVISINIPALHSRWDLPLLARETLCYILQQCQQQQAPSSSSSGGHRDEGDEERQGQAFRFKRDEHANIKEKIRGLKIKEKMQQIESKIEEAAKSIIKEETESNRTTEEAESKAGQVGSKKKKIEPFDLFFKALRLTQQSAAGPPGWSSTEEAAEMLRVHIEQGEAEREPEICLDIMQYQDILGHLFPASSSSNDQLQPQQEATTATAATALGEEQIREIVRQLLQQEAGNKSSEDKTDKPADAAAPSTNNQSLVDDADLAATIEETKMKLTNILWEIKSQMVIKGIVDKINKYVEHKEVLVILQDDEGYLSFNWDDTRKALSLMCCANGSAVIVTTKNSQAAREFCYPEREPMTCSLVGVYYDRVLQLIEGSRLDKEEDNKQRAGIIVRDILDRCDPHEFCMKIFVHALYANPNRSYEELVRLKDHLVWQQNHPLDSNANATKMFKFSYDDLRKEYKSCLLYLAIFPQGHSIRRSTLVGRWIAEGLITMEDWPSAVRHAERCFDTLVDRWLVCPGDVGAKGEVKTCIVGEQVHGIITKMARKQHIVETRLSHHLARHFSIFSDLRLRRSDSINKFVQKLHKYALQLTLLKVLDLEGCQCFKMSTLGLRNICNRILLLKYLSLRRTDVTNLPGEINNLHELEILDIRQTQVPACDTKQVVLLKLKRFMAGDGMAMSWDNDGESSFSSVRIPYKIKMMESMEVLSNVKASRHGYELKDIRKLWQLKKLGVVISNKPSHIRYFLRAISDLHECLQSLSITLLGTNISTIDEGTSPPGTELGIPADDIRKILDPPPEHLKSLNISGTTHRGQLPVLMLVKCLKKLTKLTLSRTWLKQDSLKDIGELPNLLCLRLGHESHTDEQIIFNNGEFNKLNLLVVECSVITSICFTNDGAAPKLNKIIWSFDNMESLSGINHLPELKELELNGKFVPDQVREAIRAHPKKPNLTHMEPHDQEKERSVSQDPRSLFSFRFSKINKLASICTK